MPAFDKAVSKKADKTPVMMELNQEYTDGK